MFSISSERDSFPASAAVTGTRPHRQGGSGGCLAFRQLGPWSPSPRPSMSTYMSHRRLRKHHRIHSTVLTGKAVKTLDGRYSTRKRTARRMGSAVYVALPMPIVNYLSFTDTEARMRGVSRALLSNPFWLLKKIK